jgi:hypothetical protein
VGPQPFLHPRAHAALTDSEEKRFNLPSLQPLADDSLFLILAWTAEAKKVHDEARKRPSPLIPLIPICYSAPWSFYPNPWNPRACSQS